MTELTNTKIETAVVGLFIQAARAKEPILVEKNGEVSFSAELLRDFHENFQVVLRVEGQVHDGEDQPRPEGIHRAVLRVEPRERVLAPSAKAIEKDETDFDPDTCPRCGSEDWDLDIKKCGKCGYQGEE